MRSTNRILKLTWFLLTQAVVVLSALPFVLAQERSVGLWNGFQQQLNVLECSNPTFQEQNLAFVVRTDTGEVLGERSLTLPIFGSVHSILNEFPIIDQYGILELSPGVRAEVSCSVIMYRFGWDGVQYAIARKLGDVHTGPASGVYNALSPDIVGPPVLNWLTIANTGQQPFSATIELRSMSGERRLKQLDALPPYGRIDIQVGDLPEDLVGVYTILPNANQQPYIAALHRYSAYDINSFRFGFAAEASTPRCHAVLPISTMGPALNWLELANPRGTATAVRVAILGMDGAVRAQIEQAVEPYAQLHILANDHLGPNTVGAAEINCLTESAGVLANSVFYGFNADYSSLQWAYLSPPAAIATRGSAIIAPLNTFLGASNWQKVHSSGSLSALSFRTFDELGTTQRLDTRNLPAQSSSDYPYHEPLGVDKVGMGVAAVDATAGGVFHEAIRVYPHIDGSIATIARIPTTQIVTPNFPDTNQGGVVTGETKVWHPLTVTFDGPVVAESDAANPFLNYRLDVSFTHQSGKQVVVPGYFAADGRAAETGAQSGNKWRVRFAPDLPGLWSYRASFRTGSNVAVADDPAAGAATSFDGANGSIVVLDSQPNGRDFKGKGLLRYTGSRYLQFAGTGEYFLKVGANSPENFLAYEGFDQTEDTHRYLPHLADWQPGDPLWNDKGQGIIGALNYLSSVGVNALYFLTMNIQGDGEDVWPWTSRQERRRFDVSKLDQWDIVFDHMTTKGILLHVVTQERENDRLLNSGNLGTERRLYYRELIARFAHHPALLWNLGEETTNTTAQLVAYADYIKKLDPYKHPIVLHTYPNEKEEVYGPILGNELFDGFSLQEASYNIVRDWLEQSADAGRQLVASFDEQAPADDGVVPDSVDPQHLTIRQDTLWATLMAGGMGVEYYFGYDHPHDDLDLEDFRSRHNMWIQSKHARDFFVTHLFYNRMNPCSESLSYNGWCLSDNGERYAVYLRSGAKNGSLNLATAGTFRVQWYDPRSGGPLQNGSITSVNGPGPVSLGLPPSSTTSDWAVLVYRP